MVHCHTDVQPAPRRRAFLAFLVLTLLFSAPSALAVVRRVAPNAPGPAHDGASWATAYTTIQEAINAAAAGDELWVAAGAAPYSERLAMKVGVALYGGFAGTETARAQAQPAVNETIVDGTGGTTVSFPASSTAATALNGFTLRNGNPIINVATGGSPVISNNQVLAATGTAINIAAASPTIDGNTVSNANGHGIYASGGAPVLTDNVVENSRNTGILTQNGSAPVVNGNTITANRDFGIRCEGSPASINDNVITGSGAGAGAGTGAIYCLLDAAAVTEISRNDIHDNNGSGISVTNGTSRLRNNKLRGNTGTQGGAIYLNGGTPRVANNLMVNNSSFQEGGAIYTKNATATIVNNTIASNSSGGNGGALYMDGGTVTFGNNIVAYNAPGIYRLGGTLTLRKNDVFGNLVYSYQGVSAGSGDIAVDPEFAAPTSRDLHIQPTSPARNVGDPAFVLAGETDIDGQPRTQNTVVDMGADESDGTPYNIPTPILYVKPAAQGGDDSADGLSWATAKATVQAAIDAAAGGGEVWVQTGTYIEQLTLKNGVGLYGGFAGIETNKAERTGKFITVLDGGNSNAVITVPVGAGSPEVIDGFTITNGRVQGVNASLAGLTISNNVFFSDATAIFARNCALNLDRNTIRDNSVHALDAAACTVIATNNTVRNNGQEGLYTTGSSLTVTGNTFQNNGRRPFYGDAQSLVATNNTMTGNGWGPAWTGTSLWDNNTLTGNGHGISTAGAATIRNNILTGNGRAFSVAAINATGTALINANTVQNNQTTGIAVSSNVAPGASASMVITNNTVTGNVVGSATAGIYMGLSGPATGLVQNNTITANVNTAQNSPGGGLYLDGGVPQVLNNAIRGNSAGYGGGIYTNNSNAVIANNTIVSNGVARDGGGIFIHQAIANSNAGPSIINNTISGNSASGTGGGIYTNISRPIIANTIVAYNTSGIYRSANSTLNLSHNDVFGNSGKDYVGFPVPPSGNGNLSVDPRFLRPPARDLHLASASPLRNAGDNTVIQASWRDLDNEVRQEGATVDIGADEIYTTGVTVPPTLVVRVNLATGNDANNGSTWALAKRTVQGGINAAEGGGEVWVSAGTYFEKLILKAGVSLYGGFNGTETTRDARDPVANLTVIDAQLGGDAVTVPSSSGSTQTIDGFTIGNRTSGSTYTGIVITNAALVLRNDVVTLNRTGILASGAVLTLANTTVQNNQAYALNATDNCTVTVTDSDIMGNGQYGIGGDSGVLSVTGSQFMGNAWAGIGWTGTISVLNSVVDGNGGGIALSGTATVTGNVVQNNGRWSNNAAINLSGLGVISQNSVRNNGTTGIATASSAPVLTGYTMTIADNEVSGNTVNNAVAGVYCGLSGTGSALVISNTITGNANTNPNGLGGGLYLDGGAAEVQDNIIADNSAGFGAGIYLNKTAAMVANNGVSSNVASNNGGGIYVFQGTPSLINNTVASNSGGTSGNGGGIYADATTAVIANTIIAFNTSGGLYRTTNSSLNLSHNDVFGNLPLDYPNFPTDPTGTNGNISVNPQLVQPTARNLHIQETSPARNTGDNTVLQPGWVDIDDDARVEGGTVDIGADESYGEHYNVVPIVVFVNGATGNDTNDGFAWNRAKRTIQAGINAAGGGGQVWVAGSLANPPVPYTERIVVRSGVELYGGFNGTEANLAQRNWVINPTLIDGQNGGDVITVPSSAGATEIVDGFTIGNQTTGSQYAGVKIASAALIIRNSVLTLNRTGVDATGAVLTIDATRLVNNANRAISCVGNCSLTATNLQISGNGQDAIYGDSGTLNANHNTITGNAWGGIAWTGTSTIDANTVTGNGYGIGASGTTIITNNTVRSNARAFNAASIGASGFVTVDSNTVTDNASTGISVNGSLPVLTGYTVNVTNNTVTGNVVNNDTGGIACNLTGTATALIQFNQVLNNRNTNADSALGGGLYLNGGAPLALNNTIQSNGSGYGGGIFVNNSNAIIANSTIVSNAVFNSGGGIYVKNGAPKLVNLTITGNSASGEGGGIVNDAASITMANTIVAYNTNGLWKNTAASFTFSKNDVFGNLEYDARGFVLTENLNVDPQIAIAPAGNLHLRPTSPLRNAGDNTQVVAGWVDMDKQARIQGGTVDIGADESYGEAVVTTPVIVRVNGATGNDANDGTAWNRAKQTIQAGIQAAAGGGEVWVATGTYHELVILRPGVAVYGGFAGTETTRAQRAIAPAATVIDADSAGTVVTIPSGTGATVTVDGFTIRESATGAAGISISSATVVLGNLIVAQNATGISASGSVIQASNVSVEGSTARNIDCSTNCTLTMTGSTLKDSGQDGVYGNSGTLTFTNGLITNNNYGALAWTGTATITGSTVTSNGYGINISGTGTVTNNLVANNRRSFNANSINISGFATVERNFVLNNASNGIAVSGNLPVLTGYTLNVNNNTVMGNVVNDATAGVYVGLSGTATAQVRGNRIAGNRNTRADSSNGGGLYLDGGAPVVMNNTVTGNVSGFGAGIFSNATNAFIANNLVAGNTAAGNAAGRGGGIYLKQGAPTLINNTIASNAAGASGDGGGLNAETSTVTMTNNIIAFNTVGGISQNVGSVLTLNTNDVFGNTAYQYKGLPDPLGTNIKVDPLFISAATGNYHLQSTSPMINTGNDTAVQADWRDIDDQGRKQGTHVDIGADEFVAGGAVAIRFGTQPGTASAGLPFGTQPVLQAVTATNTVDTTYSGAVTFAIKPGTGAAGAVLNGTLTIPIVNGVATATNLTIDKEGNGYVLTADGFALGVVESAAFNVGVGGFTINDVKQALRIAAGMATVTPAEFTRLNVVTGAPERIDVRDAARLARKAAGKDANP